MQELLDPYQDKKKSVEHLLHVSVVAECAIYDCEN